MYKIFFILLFTISLKAIVLTSPMYRYVQTSDQIDVKGTCSYAAPTGKDSTCNGNIVYQYKIGTYGTSYFSFLENTDDAGCTSSVVVDDICPATGMIRDDDCNCVCPEGTSYDNDTNSCVCPRGTELVNIKKCPCNDGDTCEYSQCLEPCPDGTQRNSGGGCCPIGKISYCDTSAQSWLCRCPYDQAEINGTCTICDGSYPNADSSDCSNCPPYWETIDGICTSDKCSDPDYPFYYPVSETSDFIVVGSDEYCYNAGNNSNTGTDSTDSSDNNNTSGGDTGDTGVGSDNNTTDGTNDNNSSSGTTGSSGGDNSSGGSGSGDTSGFDIDVSGVIEAINNGNSQINGTLDSIKTQSELMNNKLDSVKGSVDSLKNSVDSIDHKAGNILDELKKQNDTSKLTNFDFAQNGINDAVTRYSNLAFFDTSCGAVQGVTYMGFTLDQSFINSLGFINILRPIIIFMFAFSGFMFAIKKG